MTELYKMDAGIAFCGVCFFVRIYFVVYGKTAKSILVSCGARLAPFDIKELREITMYDEL